MAPRTHPQFDEISRSIGELTAYVHEHRHGMGNLAQKFDALSLDLAKRVEAMNTSLGIRLDKMDERIAKLEAAQAKQQGATNIVAWVLKSPLIGWITAAVLFFAALWSRNGPTQ